MKVSKIAIKDFQQFKDFELDLTYPEGHPKAGQPLDKVCLIGQSGTGKTTILTRIKEFLDFHLEMLRNGAIREHFLNVSLSITQKHVSLSDVNNYAIELANSKLTKKYNISKNKEVVKYRAYKSSFFISPYNNDTAAFLEPIKELSYIFFNAELLDKGNEFIIKSNINPRFYITDDADIKQHVDIERANLFQKRAYDFSVDSPIDIWKMVLHEAKEYMLEEIKYTRQLSKLMLNDIDNASKFIEEIKVWRKSVVNPFQELAKKANTFLHHFNLELKVNMDFENPEDMKFVLVQPLNKHKEKLDYQTWSTGTKQIIMTATPLFALDTKDTIILMDEPERSLFPDIQRTLINYYTELAPEAQFFFATHSPLIASQFEPCERFILTFDEETGFVKAHRGIAPEGDDPNDVLVKDFGMRHILGEKGVAAWERFVELKMLIRNEKDEKAKEILVNEFLQLQHSYNF